MKVLDYGVEFRVNGTELMKQMNEQVTMWELDEDCIRILTDGKRFWAYYDNADGLGSQLSGCSEDKLAAIRSLVQEMEYVNSTQGNQ